MNESQKRYYSALAEAITVTGKPRKRKRKRRREPTVRSEHGFLVHGWLPTPPYTLCGAKPVRVQNPYNYSPSECNNIAKTKADVNCPDCIEVQSEGERFLERVFEVRRIDAASKSEKTAAIY